jgi:hypothetical protein
MIRFKSLSTGGVAWAMGVAAVLPSAHADTIGKIWSTPVIPVTSAYQNPDGSYPSYTDFYRDLEGTPCGIRCTQRARSRWNAFSGPRAYYGAFSH